MKKKYEDIDYRAELERSFERWEYIRDNGASDPFWADGFNMNLVRNHISFYRIMIERTMQPQEYPEIYFRGMPPEVNSKYMARPDEIRANAAIAMQRIDEDENLEFIRKQSRNLSQKQLKQLCIPAVIGYAENLRTAISEDDLVTMRRYERPDHYLEAFRSLAEKLGSAEVLVSLETISCDDEDYNCDEGEQTELAAAPEKPQEYIQLTLF